MMQILFPVVRMSDVSKQLAPFVRNMAKVFKARVHIFRVEPPIDAFIEMRVKEANEWLDELIPHYFGGIEVHRAEVVMGDPAGEILNYLRCNEIDFVIMGTHGRKRWGEGGLFGSVTKEIVGKAPVPVLTLNLYNITDGFNSRSRDFLQKFFGEAEPR